MDAREGVILVLSSLSGEHHVTGTVALPPELLGSQMTLASQVRLQGCHNKAPEPGGLN